MNPRVPQAALWPAALLHRFEFHSSGGLLIDRKNLWFLAGLALPGVAICLLGWPFLLRLTAWVGLPAPRQSAFLILTAALSVLAWGAWLLFRARLNQEYRNLALAAVNEELVITVRELRRTDRELKLAASFPDQSPNPILRLGVDGRILYANKSGRPILNDWSLDVGRKAPALWIELAREALARGEREVEIRIGEQDYSVLLWPMPELEYVNLYWFDLTDRKTAERQLMLTGSVFEMTHDGIVITDPRGIIRQVNPAFEEITGYGPQEVIGQPLRIIDPSHRNREEITEFWTEIEAEGRWQGEIWNRRKNGEAYPEWQTVSLIRDEQGRPAHLISVFSDITAIMRDQEEIRRQAHHDALTGLPNRLLFGDRLRVALSQARRKSGRLALLFLDLDCFKVINDSLGHDIGDLLLIEAARRLAKAFREEDTVARLGGDEFIVLLRDIKGVADAREMAAKIISSLSTPCSVNGCDLPLTASVGVALYPDHGLTAEDLIKNADAAMYRAKDLGRNNYQVFSPDLPARSGRRLIMEKNLRRPPENGEAEM